MTASADIALAKANVRAQAKVARCEISPGDCTQARTRIAERVISEVLSGRSVGTVLGYGATPEELDPSAILEALRELGACIALPRIEEAGVLGIHSVEAEDELVSGIFGLQEPAATAPRVPLERIDVVIVPGLAFDRAGRRIGYGGGYYDRLLPRLRSDCLRIGIAFDQQVFAEVPADDHDQGVDVLVTASGDVVWTGARGLEAT